MKKRITVEQIREKIALLERYGVSFSANFIVGFDCDTEDTFAAMYEFIRANGLTGHAKVSYLTPLPRTLEYVKAQQRGLIPDEWEYVRGLGDLYFELMLNMTGVSDARLRYWYEGIARLGQRDMPLPTSSRYLTRLAGHYFNRAGLTRTEALAGAST